MAEQENGSSPLAEALARVGDRRVGRAADCPALLGAAVRAAYQLTAEGTELAGALRLLAHWGARHADPAEAPGTPRAAPFSRPADTALLIRSPGSAPAPVPAQLKQVVHASADEVDVRVVESGDHAMPERVDHAVPGPIRSATSSSSPTAVMRPADKPSAAASGRAGSPVEIRPLQRTRSAVRAMPGRVAAAVAMAVLGAEEGTSVLISCGGSLACRPGC
jgi:hypothetical protein